MVTSATRTYADALVSDDGVSLRRAGVALICVSGTLALLGFTALTLAYETYSGYVVQASGALGLGLVGVAIGWHVLRRGDRLGPRLMPYPAMARIPRFEPEAPRRARVHVHSQPIAALQPAPRRTTPIR